MSSKPGDTLEAFLMWQYGLIVDGDGSSNPSLEIAERALHIPSTRTSISQAEFAPLLALHEPFREDLESVLNNFDDDNQSWRDYSPGVSDTVSQEVCEQAEEMVKGLRFLKRARDSGAVLSQLYPEAPAVSTTEKDQPMLSQDQSGAFTSPDHYAQAFGGTVKRDNDKPRITSLEAFVMWRLELVVPGTSFAEELSGSAPRAEEHEVRPPSFEVSQEDFNKLLEFYEPHRGEIEAILVKHDSRTPALQSHFDEFGCGSMDFDTRFEVSEMARNLRIKDTEKKVETAFLARCATNKYTYIPSSQAFKFEAAPVEVDYTNYRGERAIRKIIPQELVFGRNEYHTEPQWLMHVWDLEKQAQRTYAISGIHRWGCPTLNRLEDESFTKDHELKFSTLDLMEAAAAVGSNHGHMTGTSNWGAAMMNFLQNASKGKKG